MMRVIKQLANRVIDKVAESTAQRVVDEVADEISRGVSKDIAGIRYGVNLLRLDTILKSAPKGTPPWQLFGDVDDDFWFWAQTEGYRGSAALRELLPDVPHEKTQFQYVGLTGDKALKAGFDGSRVFKKLYEDVAGDFSACSNVLDFGCGWGRVIRFFLKDIDASKLWGIDPAQEMIQFCQQAFKWGNFRHIDPFQSTKFADGMFDLVYALSVFSHLSEDMHWRWIEEIHRILRPGGVLIATTRGRDFITHCRELKTEKNLNAVSKHLPTLFVDTDQFLSAYDQGRFCFDSTIESYGEMSSWAGEACVPKGYVAEHWAKLFKVIDYIDAGPRRDVFEQNIIVVQK